MGYNYIGPHNRHAFFIILNFYIFSSVINVESFFYIFIVLSVMTDGLFVFIQLPRRAYPHKNTSFDPSKLTIVIVCYNGNEVIAETIEQAAIHVPLKQIIVVSDASTDNTVDIARAMGVRVFQNRRNVNKAFSISAIMKHVPTPYVLILDDDTLIGKTLIPTSLLDEGYTAVAFNVMPVKEDLAINDLQRFEYRKSMQIGKNLRSRVGAIGNVSGAIGLYRTADLLSQARLHSGQFSGEDEQRTALVHLYGTGKGITYTDSLVQTKAPDSLRRLLRQRAFGWSLSVPEIFFINWKILLHPKQHYLLKAEKAYQMYIYMTDPLRILFFWILFTRPTRIFAIYAFYLVVTLAVWAKMKYQDKLWVVFAYPFYSLIMSACRFVGQFYWYVVKFRYFVKNKYHHLVPERKLILEFVSIVAITALLWVTSIKQFDNDLQLLSKIQRNRIDNFDTGVLDYEKTQEDQVVTSADSNKSIQSITISTAPSDSAQSLAEKALTSYSAQMPLKRIDNDRRSIVAIQLMKIVPLQIDTQSNTISIPVSMIERAIDEAPRA